MSVRDASPAELADWDAQAVEAPGGHVYQSRAWAEHRAASGWRPRFLVGDDAGRALALIRPWAIVGGASGYLPRGPVPVGTDDATLAARLIALGDALAESGVDVVAADPEVPAADQAFRQGIEAAGFHAIEEIQPSRHRISLPLGPDADETAVFEAIAKSTRQRIRGAEKVGVAIVRHDVRAGLGGAAVDADTEDAGAAPSDGNLGGDASDEGFSKPIEPAAAALDRFYDLLLETGERRHFSFGPRQSFVAWWSAALAAGHLIYLEARAGDAAGEPLAGLVLYRHGGRLSTVHSGDHEGTRKTHPGALHLLRWRAIQLAIREGSSEMDLGGVDTAGARSEPREGDDLYGLYQHKQSFGGRWLELTGAYERVYDPRGYQLGRLASRAARIIRR